MIFKRAVKSLFPMLVFLPSLYAQEVTPSSPLVLTLDDAVDRALKYNQGILAADYGVREAEAGVAIGRSQFFPQISIQGSYTRLAKLPALEMTMPEYGVSEFPVFGPMGDTIGFTYVPGIVGADTLEFQMGDEENYLGRASLQQPLFTWGKILNAYQMSSLNAEAAREDYRKTENELAFSVTKAFYGILVLEELVQLVEEAQEQTARHVAAVENRYDAGLASKFDLLRAKVQLANMEPQVVTARNGLELALAGLRTLIGLPQETAISLEGELSYEPVELDLAQSVERAKAHRPEIRSFSLKKRMAGKALSIAKKANWPNLVLTANYDYKKPLYFQDEWGRDWNVVVALQMPLFTGFGNLGKIDQARARFRQAEHGLRLLEETVELEVKSAYLQVGETGRLVESQKGNVAQAEEAQRIAQDRYERGLATSLEVMDTQLALTQARTNYLKAVSDYIIARAEIDRAVGR